MIEYSWFIRRRCENGYLKNHFNYYFRYRLYRAVRDHPLQEGKSAGLGTISGAADTYWGQNKGRSMEGALVKSTKFLAVLFIVLALVLNLKFFN